MTIHTANETQLAMRETPTAPGDPWAASPAIMTNLTSATLNYSQELASFRVLGETTDTHKPTYKNFNLTVEGYLDATEAIKDLIKINTDVQFRLAPEGYSSGNSAYTGRGYIQSVTWNSQLDSPTTVSFTVISSSALTTVAIGASTPPPPPQPQPPGGGGGGP